MRSFLFLAPLLCVVVSLTPVHAQWCGDVTLSSQAEVDAFNCTNAGELTIEGDDITDLSPLSDLVEVVDGLSIVGNGSLTSLEGLVGSELALGAWKYCGCITISHNPLLESLSGLENIYFRPDSDKLITIENNSALSSLEGLSDLGLYHDMGLVIKDQDAWTSIEGLEMSVPSLNRIELIGNDSLTSLEAMESMVAGRVGRIKLSSNPLISSLQGLEGVTSVSTLDYFDGLIIQNMDGLSSLEGLGNISHADALIVKENSSLSSLEGLEAIGSVDQLTIEDNEMLLSIGGLDGLEEAGGCYGCVAVTIRGNDALESLSGLENLTHITYGVHTGIGLRIEGNSELRNCSCGLRGLISGDPPTFSGVDDEVDINNNDPAGACTSPEVVLATPCQPVANEDESGAPEKLGLEAYPNPSAGPAAVQYELPEAGPVRIAVFDLLGREVAVLADGIQPVGQHEAQLDGLAAGTYVVRIEVGDGEEVLSRRVTVVN